MLSRKPHQQNEIATNYIIVYLRSDSIYILNCEPELVTLEGNTWDVFNHPSVGGDHLLLLNIYPWGVILKGIPKINIA